MKAKQEESSDEAPRIEELRSILEKTINEAEQTIESLQKKLKIEKQRSQRYERQASYAIKTEHDACVDRIKILEKEIDISRQDCEREYKLRLETENRLNSTVQSLQIQLEEANRGIQDRE
ncbi:MAG: hypothetical protein EZS28_045433, partial [Streblomastix strix]